MMENLFLVEPSSTPESQLRVGKLKTPAKPPDFFRSTVSVQYQKCKSVLLLTLAK